MTTLTNDEKFTASFVFYYSFADMISKIPDREIRLQAYEILFEYALFGTEPQIEHWAVDMVFSAVKPQIDANNKRRKNGKKGGRKPAQEKATQAQTQTAAQVQAQAQAQPEAEAQPAVQVQPAAKAETQVQVEAAARTQAESAIQITQAKQKAPTMQAEPIMQAQPSAQIEPAMQAQPAAAAQPTSAAQAQPAVQVQPAAAAQAEAAAQTQQTTPTQSQQQPASSGIKSQQQKIIYFGENQYPTTLEELQKFEALGHKLFRQYHHNSALSPTDLEQVLERTYTRIVRPDGQAIAAFDRNKADLLEYAFEKAQSAGKLDWRYLDGMYRNFAAQNIVTRAEARQYDLERTQRFVSRHES